MSAETQQFEQLWAEKTQAKERALGALGQALWNDAHEKDSAAEWSALDEYGLQGIEGQKFAQAERLAIDTVTAHPEWFAVLDGKTVEQIAEYITAISSIVGMEDDVTLATMYELAKYERQNIGGRVETRVRLPNLGGKK